MKVLPEAWEKVEGFYVLLSALRILFLRGYRNSHMGAITRVLEEHAVGGSSIPVLVSAASSPAPASVIPASSLVLASKAGKSDEELVAAVRAITRQGRREPQTTKVYMGWASTERMEAIVRAKPQSIEELAKISGVGANFLSHGAEIVRLFTV